MNETIVLPSTGIIDGSRGETVVLNRPVSQREADVVRLLMGGASNKTIARELYITEATVKIAAKSIFQKLHAGNRTSVAIWVVRNL